MCIGTHLGLSTTQPPHPCDTRPLPHDPLSAYPVCVTGGAAGAERFSERAEG